MNYKHLSKIIASSIIGVIFIVSAITKLFPIQLFESALVEGYFSNWNFAPFTARIIIAFEFLLGSLLLFNLYFAKRVLKVSIATLIVFSIHLLIVIVTEGNTKNCMCFGNIIILSPLASIFKNILLIVMFFILYKFHNGILPKKPNRILLFLTIFSIAVPLTQPFQTNTISNNDDVVGNHLFLERVTDTADHGNLAQGKHIIAFMSFTCSHCKIAAYKLHVMKKKNPDLPIFLFFYGNESNLAGFLFETKTHTIPNALLSDVDFVYRSGVRLPAIYFVDADTIVKKVNYTTLHQDDIEKWLRE